MSATQCPVCNENLAAPILENRLQDRISVMCPNCGSFSFTFSLQSLLETQRWGAKQRAMLSFAIRRIERNDDRPVIASDFAENILKGNKLPSAAEQLENLVLFLGQTLGEPGETIQLEPSKCRAILGSITTAAASWTLRQAYELGLVQGIKIEALNSPFQLLNATLSLRGWKMYSDLQQSAGGAKKAFMAMKFNDTELTSVFQSCFVPSVRRAGFELRKLDDEPRAGLIDDRLRLEIRTSRFLIADLTHANPGAYWEAGFAEGLGRPVIYTCRKDIFDDSMKRPHFDTNHHLTIVWDPANLEKAANDLATTIRVTLPSEAKLSD